MHWYSNLNVCKCIYIFALQWLTAEILVKCLTQLELENLLVSIAKSPTTVSPVTLGVEPEYVRVMDNGVNRDQPATVSGPIIATRQPPINIMRRYRPPPQSHSTLELTPSWPWTTWPADLPQTMDPLTTMDHLTNHGPSDHPVPWTTPWPWPWTSWPLNTTTPPLLWTDKNHWKHYLPSYYVHSRFLLMIPVLLI